MLVSIVIPAYNTEKYIRECIESCFRQTYRNIEIICVNDGSKDNTGKIIDSMLSEDRRLKVIHQENAGVTAARMAGTKAAQGNYIFYLDSDDVLTEHCIATLIQKSENGMIDMVSGGRKEIYNHQFVYKPSLEPLNHSFFCGEDCFIEVMRRYEATLFPRLIKKDLCLKTNIPQSIKWAEDAAMLFQIVAMCNKTVYVDELVYFYRCNPESVTSIANSKSFLTRRQAMLSMKKTVREYSSYNKIKKYWLARDLICELQTYWSSHQLGVVGYKDELRKKFISNLFFHPSVAKIILENQRKYFLAAILASFISKRLAIKILRTMRHCSCEYGFH